MQFVRTVTNKRQRTIKRKLYEILLSRLIQYRYSKIRILRGYLNCAFFGSQLNGATKASLHIYQKHPDDLTLDEAAELAAMLVYPRPLQPTAQWRKNIMRRANYGKVIYIRQKQKFDKIKIAELT